MSLAQDKYIKQVKNADLDRGDANAGRAAAVGALAGALAPKKFGTFGKRVGAGLLGGAVAVKGVRALTGPTKDEYGERSRGAKTAEKIPAAAGLVLAGLYGRKRLQRLGRVASVTQRKAARTAAKVGATASKAAGKGAWDLVKEGLQGAIGLAALTRPVQFSLGGKLKGALKRPSFQTAAALAGGITVSDIATSAAFPERKETRAQAALHGLKKGALYGGTLAIGEPILHRLLKKGATKLSARRNPILFGYADQLRYARNKTFAPPVEAWVQDRDVQAGGKNVDVTHRQLIGAAWRKGQKIQVGVRRGTGLVSDAARAVTGQQKVDSRGRPLKNEWDKSWFKNAVSSAALGTGYLGVGALRRYGRTQPNTPLGQKIRTVEAGVMKVRRKAEQKITQGVATAARKIGLSVPLFKTTASGATITFLNTAAWLASRRDLCPPHPTLNLFDYWAEAHGWDVRDPRGRSARVFAPGAQKRERRPKEWHEKVDNIRKIAAGAGVAALAGGALGGFVLGKRFGKTVRPGGAAKVFPLPSEVQPRWKPSVN